MKRNKSGHPLGTLIEIMREDLDAGLVAQLEKTAALAGVSGKWLSFHFQCPGEEDCPFAGNQLDSHNDHQAWFDGRTGRLVKVRDWALPQPEEPR